MAHTILYNVVAEILKKLGSQAFQEIRLWWGVTNELNKLGHTVSTIQAVLLDAEEKYYSEGSRQLKDWLEKLKEAIYDADDLLDDFSTEVLRRQVMSGNKFFKGVHLFFSSSNQFAYSLKMSHKIKDIRDKLKEIAEDRQMFHFMERQVEAVILPKEREQTHSSLPEVFIGREKDKKEIMQLLFSSDYKENIVVIPIVGIGGLGKTTLAQCIFNEGEVVEKFELRVWVCVSNHFDIMLIVEKILESARIVKAGSQMELLKNQLFETINGKKYLIVLDDIWSDDPMKWSQLRDLLIGGAPGSRILVTTRLQIVAKIMGSLPKSYQLEGLEESESWILFKRIACRLEGEPSSPSQEVIGREIVKKCKGVPLAIKAIGSLLHLRDSESEWLLFRDQELYKVQQGENETLSTLKLSYNHLSSHLKRCFAYCGLFPKNYVIEVNQLIELWMAQGYIIQPANSTQCLEDIGYDYCIELLSRSFLEVAYKYQSENITHVKMHDLMHDLATSMARPEISNMIDLDEKTRHMSIYGFNKVLESRWQKGVGLLKENKLRTILNVNMDFLTKASTSDFVSKFFVSKLRRLRVLDLSHMGIEVVPHSIYKLKHLRYVDLTENRGIEKLPESITRLQNLQVLVLDYCFSLKRLPKDIHKLVNLRRLGIDHCDGLRCIPHGIGKLTSLRELSTFVVANPNHKNSSGSGELSELRDLNNLRGSLSIHNLHFVKNSASSVYRTTNLKEKQHLESLKLMWVEGCNNDEKLALSLMEAMQPHPNLRRLEVLGYGGVKFPIWISSLSNIISLMIRKCGKIQNLPPLHHLLKLQYLEIKEMTNLEYINSSNRGGGDRSTPFLFPSLKQLYLERCPNLKGWWPPTPTSSTKVEEQEAFPYFNCLSELRIESCPETTSIPLFPGLESLELRCANLELLHHILHKIPQPQPELSSSFALPSSFPYP